MHALNVIGPLKTYIFFTVFKQLSLNSKYMFSSNALDCGAAAL